VLGKGNSSWRFCQTSGIICTKYVCLSCATNAETDLVSPAQDKPEKLAAVLVDFWRRNTTTLVLPPKIGGAPAAQPVKMVGEE
jgi:hypothetical protein